MMSTNDLLARALASLRKPSSSPRARDGWGACTPTSLRHASSLRRALKHWRSLAGASPFAKDTPLLHGLHAHAGQIGRTLQEANMPTTTWFDDAVPATRVYLGAAGKA